MIQTYTVFCQEVDGAGTVWIDSVECSTVDEAVQLGREKCAGDWGYDVDDVRCLGVAEGNVEIVYWDDLE